MVAVLRYIFMFLLVFSAPVFAQEQDVFKELQSLKDVYNENVDKVPGVLKSLFGNERMNVYIEYQEGDDLILGVVTKNGKVVELKKGEISEPTMKVTLKASLIKSVFASQDPAKEFLDAFNRGEIAYEAYSTTKKIKLFFVKIIAKLLGFF